MKSEDLIYHYDRIHATKTDYVEIFVINRSTDSPPLPAKRNAPKKLIDCIWLRNSRSVLSSATRLINTAYAFQCLMIGNY